MATRLHAHHVAPPLPFRFHEARRTATGDGSGAMSVRIAAEGFADHAIRDRIDFALRALAMSGRRAIRILDAACGDGRLLLHAVRSAAALGFVAIEARGIDPSARRIAAARAAAAALNASAIGLVFEVGGIVDALHTEEDDGCDIVLCLERIGQLTAGERNAVAVRLARIAEGTLFVADEALGRGGLRALSPD